MWPSRQQQKSHTGWARVPQPQTRHEVNTEKISEIVQPIRAA